MLIPGADMDDLSLEEGAILSDFDEWFINQERKTKWSAVEKERYMGRSLFRHPNPYDGESENPKVDHFVFLIKHLLHFQTAEARGFYNSQNYYCIQAIGQSVPMVELVDSGTRLVAYRYNGGGIHNPELYQTLKWALDSLGVDYHRVFYGALPKPGDLADEVKRWGKPFYPRLGDSY